MNIVLIGFMGSGKTTIGKELALQKGFKLIDTDEMIEKEQNISIKEIFSSKGEAYFRELEKQAIQKLQALDNHIVSVGGGAVMYHNNLDVLKGIGITVFLDAPIEKILENLKGKFRPLVGDTIEEEKLKELLRSRYSTYKKADVTIHTANLSIQQTVNEIIKALSL
ncbi:MAG: Shikimate kinase [Clostridia bacterium]|jgi:shikimate kinase|nr:Shikimate kinase [Clostridia bacterium]